jgi:hypothetical protein
MAKDIKKMQEPMRLASYSYCDIHDVYFDEWLKCPACYLQMLFNRLQDIETLKETCSEIVSKFNPQDRD